MTTRPAYDAAKDSIKELKVTVDLIAVNVECEIIPTLNRLETKADALETKFDMLEIKFDALTTEMNAKFDDMNAKLVALLTLLP